jgi:hypothetical protein
MTPIGRPSNEQMRAYLDGEHGTPHPEAVAVIRDNLDRAIRSCGEEHPFNGWKCALNGGHTEPYHSAGREKRWRVPPAFRALPPDSDKNGGSETP